MSESQPKAITLFFLCGFQHGRRIGVLNQDIGTCTDQLECARTLLVGIEPLADPRDFRRDFRIHRLRAERVGVDVAHHFRNRHGGNEAEPVALADLAGEDAREIGPFVGACLVHRYIRRRAIAGSMFEFHVGKIFCDLQHRIEITVGRAENDLVALARQVAESLLRFRAFRHIFNIRRLDALTEFGLDRLACLVVRIGPAAVADRTDVDEGDLQRAACDRTRRRCANCGFFLCGSLVASEQRARGHKHGARQRLPLQAFDHVILFYVCRQSSNQARMAFVRNRAAAVTAAQSGFVGITDWGGSSCLAMQACSV
jgi:hypothetical protein